MTAFAGIVTFGGTSDNIPTDEQLIRALVSARTAKARARRLGDALFAQRIAVPASGGPGEPLPVASNDGHTLFVADARLDNRGELAATLTISAPELARTPDSTLILRMFERWGEAGLARCLGAFAFAHWDATARRLILGRDCLGNRALFFHRGEGFVAFATTLGAMLAMPCVPRQIDELALADFLVANLTEPRKTFYRGVERVPSRTLVTVSANAARHEHYWSPNVDTAPPYRREEDYIERARELFDQAVAACTADTPHVAIAASGGLDSSAIAATVARIGHAESITCYTMVPQAGTEIDHGPHKYLDERDKMTALARMYPAINVRFFAPEKPHRYEEDVTRLFARTQMPTLGAVLLGGQAYMHDAIAEAGHRAMLVGTAGNFGLTWGGEFSLLALLRSGQWRSFAREFHAGGRRSGRSLARIFASDVVMPAAPIGLRRLIYRLRGRDPDSVSRYSALKPEFIAEHGLHARWLEQGFDPWRGVTGRDPVPYRSHVLFDHNQIGRDFRGTSIEWLGYDTRDPHGDRRLLEFLLAVPEPMYRRDGIPRSFARSVLADRLPKEILQEHRHGAAGVNWFSGLNAKRQDIATELERLEASPLASRMVDLPRLKRLMQEWPADEHAAERRMYEFRLALSRGAHVGRFIRWVEGGNA